MNVMTLLAALLAGAAVLLIVYGLFGRRRTGVEERLERYALRSRPSQPRLRTPTVRASAR